ncbi:ABC transporter ATP-binding protein [Kitasatospora sp. MAP5-34]|uniref:ABC transporter ATP-binding protein n=1 Tax=Kitasatospora sp. MAP5-34 TaxID=3035102 RepID=UPI002475E58F|nr:ABC transporter ATP-binding protein [Kitasatospora sp. MAP5-34]MDH6574975.1 ATP-binding cassette subfamily B protein [Kitasatospora sp. MAP5-34]
MRGSTLALALAVPAEAAATLALPGTVAGAVDAVLGGNATAPGLLLGVVLLGGAAAGALAAAAGPGCAADATVALRSRLLRHVLAVGPAPHGLPSGDLTSRLVGSAADAGGAFPARLGALTALLTSLGAVVGLGVLSPWLAPAFFAGVLPGIVLIRLFLQQAGQVFTRYQEAQSELAARLTGALGGLRSIHAAGAEEREAARVLGPLPELSAAGHALWSTQRRTVWQATLLVAVVELAVLGTAGWQVADGVLPPGALAAAAGWAALGVGFFEQVEALAGVAHARSGLLRVAEALAVPAPSPGCRLLPDGPGELVFREVVVRDGGNVLLGPLDLTVPGGRTVALVGRSGSGKSLLAALAGRLRAPDAGYVLVDGVRVDELTVPELRRAVGFAFERPVLVGATVTESLEGAGPAEARAAYADGFLARLPDGYRTPPAELRLSGGELQRLGLARLLAQQPRVMILDDATSSLDLATEHHVTQALADSTRGRTRLIVAHRAQAAARADLVAWLDAGRLRALAPHAELLAEPDYRAALVGTAAAQEYR